MADMTFAEVKQLTRKIQGARIKVNPRKKACGCTSEWVEVATVEHIQTAGVPAVCFECCECGEFLGEEADIKATSMASH